jgi:hypothetical protein
MMMKTVTRTILMLILSFPLYSAYAESQFIFPISQTEQNPTQLKVKIPFQYRALKQDEKGGIPGILTFLIEGHDQDIQDFIFEGRFMLKKPQIIRIQQSPTSKQNAKAFIQTIKTKMQNDLLVPPEFLEEYSQTTKTYSMYALGMILGYSGQANVEVIYLQYYSDSQGLYGIQVEKTLPPQQGKPVPLRKAKTQLNALRLFTSKIAIARKKSQ